MSRIKDAFHDEINAMPMPGEPMPREPMTPEDFIDLIKRRCLEKIKGEARFLERDSGSDDAYKDVINLIKSYESGDYRHG